MSNSSHPTLAQTVFDTTDARRLAEFYRELLGFAYRPGDEPPAPGADDPRGRDWLVLLDASGARALAFQQVDELPPSTWPERGVPQQLHLDLMVASRTELDAQHERAMALGARLLVDSADSEEEPIRIYADPSDHPFCIFVG